MIIIRLLLTAVLLYFIYFETGPLTVVFFALIALTFEAYSYSFKIITEAMKEER